MQSQGSNSSLQDIGSSSAAAGGAKRDSLKRGKARSDSVTSLERHRSLQKLGTSLEGFKRTNTNESSETEESVLDEGLVAAAPDTADVRRGVGSSVARSAALRRSRSNSKFRPEIGAEFSLWAHISVPFESRFLCVKLVCFPGLSRNSSFFCTMMLFFAHHLSSPLNNTAGSSATMSLTREGPSPPVGAPSPYSSLDEMDAMFSQEVVFEGVPLDLLALRERGEVVELSILRKVVQTLMREKSEAQTLSGNLLAEREDMIKANFKLRQRLAELKKIGAQACEREHSFIATTQSYRTFSLAFFVLHSHAMPQVRNRTKPCSR
jgi:hypothetical protein